MWRAGAGHGPPRSSNSVFNHALAEWRALAAADPTSKSPDYSRQRDTRRSGPSAAKNFDEKHVSVANVGLLPPATFPTPPLFSVPIPSVNLTMVRIRLIVFSVFLLPRGERTAQRYTYSLEVPGTEISFQRERRPVLSAATSGMCARRVSACRAPTRAEVAPASSSRPPGEGQIGHGCISFQACPSDYCKAVRGLWGKGGSTNRLRTFPRDKPMEIFCTPWRGGQVRHQRPSRSLPGRPHKANKVLMTTGGSPSSPSTKLDVRQPVSPHSSSTPSLKATSTLTSGQRLC